MGKFVLTAELKLQAPNNINSVVDQINSRLKDIKINFKLQNASQAVNSLDKVTRSSDKAAQSVNKLGNAFGISLKRFAAFSIASRAIGLFSNRIGGAIEKAIDFQNEMVRLSQITGDSLSKLKGVSDQVGNLATSLGVSSQKILSVTDILAQAGLQSRDLTVAINTLAKTDLAPTFGKIEDTAQGAVAILAQFGEGVGALERQLGAINKVSAKFAVESEDLISVVRRTGGVFKASGGTLEELLALFTSVRATTRESAESIATGLRTIFTRIQRPQTIEYLKQFGVQLTDLNGKFIGPYKAVEQLSQALAGLEEGDVRFIQIAEELGGYRQIGKVIPLLRQFEVSQRALQAAQEGQTSLDEDVAISQQSLQRQFIKTQEAFLKLVRDISETSSFQILIKTGLNFANALIKIADSIKPLIPLLAAFAAIKFTQNVGAFFSGIGAGFKKVVGPQAKASGGKIHAFAAGGLVPGTGNSDTVPAMLTPGEFVIRKSSVNKIGSGKLAAMNENRYAEGGVVEDIVKTPGISQQLKNAKVNTPEEPFKKGTVINSNDKLKTEIKIIKIGPSDIQKDKEAAEASQDKTILKNIKQLDSKNQRVKGKAFEDYLLNTKRTQLKSTRRKNEIYPVDFEGPNEYAEAKNVQSKIHEHIYIDKLFRARVQDGTYSNLNQKPSSAGNQNINLGQLTVFERAFASGGLIQKFMSGTSGRGVEESPKTPGVNALTPEQNRLYVLAGRVKGLTPFLPAGTNPKRILPSASIFDYKIASQTIDRWALANSEKIKKQEEKQTKAAIPTKSISELPQYGAIVLQKKKTFASRQTDFGKPKREFALTTAYLDSSSAQNIQDSIIKDSASKIINNVANYMLGSISKKPISDNASDSVPNLSAITGSLFEGAIRKIRNSKSISDGDPDKLTFDFPRGIGARAAKIFGADAKKLSKIITDAKFSSSSDAEASIKRKVTKDLNQKEQQKNKIQTGKQNIRPGRARKFAFGGPAPSDTVPALLTPGEFVINKQSAQRIGYGNLNRMNKQGVAGFAKGGPVAIQKFAQGTGGKGVETNFFKNIDTINKNVFDQFEKYMQDLGVSASDITKILKAFKENLNSVSLTVQGNDGTEYKDTDRRGAEAAARIAQSQAIARSTKGKNAEEIAPKKLEEELKKLKVPVEKITKLLNVYKTNLLKNLPIQDAFNTAAKEVGVNFQLLSKAQQQARQTQESANKKQQKNPGGESFLDNYSFTSKGKPQKADKETKSQVKDINDLVKKYEQLNVSRETALDLAVQEYQQKKKLTKQTEAVVLAEKKRIEATNKNTKTMTPGGGGGPPINPPVPPSGGGDGGGGSDGPSEKDANASFVKFAAFTGAVNTVGTSLIEMGKNADGTSTAFSRITEASLGIVNQVSAVVFALQQFGVALNVKSLKQFFGSGPGSLGDKLTGNRLANFVGPMQPKGPGLISRGFSSAKQGVASGFGAIKSGLSSGYTATKQAVTNPLATIKSGYTAARGKVSNIKDNIGNMKGSFENFIENTPGKISSGIKNAPGRIGGFIKSAPSNITSGVGKAIGGIKGAGANIGSNILGVISKVAGPLAAIGGSAALVSSAFNSVISSVYNYDEQLKNAIEAGNAEKATQIAGQSSDLEAANTTRTVGVSIGAAIGALGGPIGSAFGLVAGAAIGTAIAYYAPEWAQTINETFGGDTKSSIMARANADALAAKYTKEHADNTKEADAAIKAFESGTLSAKEAMEIVGKNALNAGNAFAAARKVTSASQANKAVVGGVRDYLTLGGILGETSTQRNTRIDKENTTREKEAFQGVKTELDSILAGPFAQSLIKSGKSTEEIFTGLKQSGAGPRKVLEELEAAASSSNPEIRKLGEQAKNTATLTINAAIRQIQEQKKFLETLNLGLYKVVAGAEAASSAFETISAQFEGIDPLTKSMKLLEAATSNQAAAMDPKEVRTATQDFANSLRQSGLSEVDVQKNVTALQGTFEAQAGLGASLEGARGKLQGLAGKGSATNPQEITDAIVEEATKNITDPKQKSTIKARLATVSEDLKGPEGEKAIKQLELGDISGVLKIASDKLQQSTKEQIDVGNLLAKNQRELTTVIQKRVDAESRAASAANKAIDIQLEAAKAIEEFGGAKVTTEQKRTAAVQKTANITRLSGITIGQGAPRDLIRAKQEADVQLAEFQRKRAAGTFTDRDAIQEKQLTEASANILDLQKSRIDLAKEDLELAKKKNAFEKSAFEKLLGGDIMGAFEDMASSAAQTLLKTGDVGLARSLGSKALLGGLKNLEETGASDKEKTIAAQTAASTLGLSPRLARSFAGTSPEEQAAKQRGIQEATALSAMSQGDVQVANAEVEAFRAFEERQRQNMASGRTGAPVLFNANQVSVPSVIPPIPSTVPQPIPQQTTSAKTSGEQRREAFRQTVGAFAGSSAAKPGGAATGIGVSQDTIKLFSSSVDNFVSAVDKLQNMQLSVKFDPTNINVNINGGSFLGQLSSDAQKEVMRIAAKEIENYRVGDGGKLTRTGVV